MSTTMPAQHGHSQACCNIPPIISKGYAEKGSYEEIGGFKTYVTGPSDTKKGILFLFDIFGYFPQSIQGADILATSHEQKHRVLIPDWFEGQACPIEWYPPTTPEMQQNLGAFFQKHNPPKVASQIPAYLESAKAKFPEITDWAVIGFCWGGKIVSLITGGEEKLFKAGAEIHPAMVDPKDAEAIKVPVILLASKDEEADAVAQFEKALKVPNHVETFSDQIHGWMAARADLEDARVKEEYARGYQAVLEFFAKHL